jgi:hypothetical protein
MNQESPISPKREAGRKLLKQMATQQLAIAQIIGVRVMISMITDDSPFRKMLEVMLEELRSKCTPEENLVATGICVFRGIP